MLPTRVSNFRYAASFRNYSASEAKIRPNLALFWPPVETGWAKCLNKNKVRSLLLQWTSAMCCSVSPHQRRLVSKIKPKVRTFWPLKFRGGWAKCLVFGNIWLLTIFLKFNLGPNLGYTVAGSPLHELGKIRQRIMNTGKTYKAVRR